MEKNSFFKSLSDHGEPMPDVEADLHIHTTASDGCLTGAQVVELAAGLSLKAIAITDHDCTNEIDQALDASASCGLKVVPGIELSTEWKETSVHVLGLWIDHRQDLLQVRLSQLRKQRDNRAGKIVAKLKACGMRIDLERIQQMAGGAVGRPHIAKALVEAGYEDKENEAFFRWLAKGAPAYVPRSKVSPAEAAALIRQVAGIPVLAHPALLGDDAVIPELLAQGLLGIEAFYPDHTPAQTANYLAIAERCNLIVSGGSDFHGKERDERFHLGGCGISALVFANTRRQADRIHHLAGKC